MRVERRDMLVTVLISADRRGNVSSLLLKPSVGIALNEKKSEVKISPVSFLSELSQKQINFQQTSSNEHGAFCYMLKTRSSFPFILKNFLFS